MPTVRDPLPRTLEEPPALETGDEEIAKPSSRDRRVMWVGIGKGLRV